MSTIQAQQSILEEKKPYERNSTKNSSKLQKQIKKIEKDVRILEVEKEKISKSDIEEEHEVTDPRNGGKAI